MSQEWPDADSLEKMTANCMEGTDKDATIKKKTVVLDGCIASNFQINEAGTAAEWSAAA